MNAQLNFSDDDENEVLVCPSCAGEYLHHEVLAVSAPENEDAKTGKRIEMDAAGRHISVEIADSFWGRREDLLVTFSCEDCQATPQLRLAQHKGRTFLQWE